MKTTQIWALIETWRDTQPFPVSQAALANRIGISRSAMSQWKFGKATPTPEHLRTLARITGIEYSRLLDALLHDLGYYGKESDHDPTPKTQARGSRAPARGKEAG